MIVIVRKLSEILSTLYRVLIFPFVRMGIEIRTGSVMKQGTYVNNGTELCGYNFLDRDVKLSNVSLGYGSYVSRNSIMNNTEIGKYTSIGCDVRTVLGTHPMNYLSTYPGFFSKDSVTPLKYVSENYFEEQVYINKEKGYQISIGNDVWIGASVIILQGVHIGDGACIAAGSVVTKDVEPYAVYGGVPAKKIKMRFSEERVKELLELKWWDKGDSFIKDNIEEFRK